MAIYFFPVQASAKLCLWPPINLESCRVVLSGLTSELLVSYCTDPRKVLHR